MESLQVKVEKVVFTSPKKWRVLKTDKGDAVGVVNFDVAEGDLLRLSGEWKRSDFNGKMQFDFRQAILDVPEDSRALLTYAVSITKGLGDAKEAEIWTAYGEAWKEHVDLDGIRGISEQTLWHWQDTLRRLDTQAEMAKTISFLLSKGLTLAMANTAWEKWESNTLAIVTDNPYSLADLPHYGFHRADSLRANFGISDNDQRRANACLLYCLSEISANGDTAASISDVLELYSAYLDPETFDNAIAALSGGKIQMLQGNNSELRICLTHMYQDEKKIYERFIQ